MKVSVIIFSLLIASLASEAQFFDSIQSSLQSPPRFDFRIDMRNSFVTTQLARIRGFKIGVDFNKRVKIGIGYNWLDSDILKGNNTEISPIRRLNFAYISPYVEYVYYRKEKWDLSIPVLVGIGRATYSTNHDQPWLIQGGSTIVLYEPYMTGQYKIVPWIGLGAGVGYRLILAGSKSLGENFNSPIYVFKAKLLVGHFYKQLTN